MTLIFYYLKSKIYPGCIDKRITLVKHICR